MPEIEYFYAAHSAYAYLGSAHLIEIARKHDCRIVHKPIDLRLVVARNGPGDFADRSAGHRQYYFGREIERWSEIRKAPTLGRTPSHHSNDITLVNCLLIAGLHQGLVIDDLAHEMLERHWRDDADLADRETLAAIVRDLGIEPEPILQRATSAEVKADYQRYTDEAIARSVFGSPTYFVDGDMFYGQDHLFMVERALGEPYAGGWPK